MALKLFLLLSLILSFSAHSESEANLIKKMQLAMDKNQPEQVEDIFDNNEDVLSKNWMAYERLALSFERRKKTKEAIEIYRKLITNFNSSAHQKIVLMKGELDSSLYQSTKLPYYYFKLALLNAELFSSSSEYTADTDKKKYLKNVEGFIGLCKKVKLSEDDIKVIEDIVLEKNKQDSNKKINSNWYAKAGFLSWQDRIYLKNKTTLVKTNILSTALGTSIGVGKKWENANYEFNLEGVYALASATAGAEEGSSSIYSQSSIPVMTFILAPGIYFKTYSEKVFFGVQLPISFRKGDFTVPNENYEFEGDPKWMAGYFVQMKFYISTIGIETKLGKLFPSPASHWYIGGVYDF